MEDLCPAEDALHLIFFQASFTNIQKPSILYLQTAANTIQKWVKKCRRMLLI
jgi:hypothetical protein